MSFLTVIASLQFWTFLFHMPGVKTSKAQPVRETELRLRLCTFLHEHIASLQLMVVLITEDAGFSTAGHCCGERTSLGGIGEIASGLGSFGVGL